MPLRILLSLCSVFASSSDLRDPRDTVYDIARLLQASIKTIPLK